MQQLILGIGKAISWVMESYWLFDKNSSMLIFKVFKVLNNILGIVLGRAYRWQHRKGKQNKIPKKK
jgi:hypothetical protein